MKRDTEIIVIGSHAPGLLVHTDRIPIAGETLIGWDFTEPVDGGKGSNQAIAAARLDARTAFVGCVGRDRKGYEAKKWMKSNGIDTRCLYYSDQSSTGIGFIILNREGVPAMVTAMGANNDLNEEMITKSLDLHRNARLMLTQFEIPPEIALFAVRESIARNLLTIVNPAPAASIPLNDFNDVYALVPNETEAKGLLGIGPGEGINPLEMVKELKDKCKCKNVIITLGGQGVVGFDGDVIWEVTPPSLFVKDTSGAGDAFCAALSVGLIRNMNIKVASIRAVTAASLSVTRMGTIPSFPNKKEVEEFSAGINDQIKIVDY